MFFPIINNLFGWKFDVFFCCFSSLFGAYLKSFMEFAIFFGVSLAQRVPLKGSDRPVFRAERRGWQPQKLGFFIPPPRMVAENEGFWLGFLTENMILVVTGILGGVDPASRSEIHILLIDKILHE